MRPSRKENGEKPMKLHAPRHVCDLHDDHVALAEAEPDLLHLRRHLRRSYLRLHEILRYHTISKIP